MPHVEHLWTVLCRNVRQGPDGLISLDGLIDMVKITGLPAESVLVPFECFVVSQWRRNDDPGTQFLQRVLFQGPTGKRVQVSGPDEVRVVDRHLFSVINRIPGLPLDGFGQYWFVVQQKYQHDQDWQDAPPTAGLWVPSPDMLGTPPEASPPAGPPGGSPHAVAQANIATPRKLGT